MPICPVCNLAIEPERMEPAGAVDESLLPLLTVNARGWEPGSPICSPCLDQWKDMRANLCASFPLLHSQPLKVLPTPFRMNAVDHLRGRGVTIAFLDSGFYAHPDLVRPTDRILEYVNMVGPSRDSDLERPDASAWHGMMTSVVGAGNGYLSSGLYRGIASEANLVLVKVGSASRIKHDDLARGVRWVTRNRRRFNIRVVNISCGGDYPESYISGSLSRAAEDATRAGLVVVAAAGNAGGGRDHTVLPPASAPSVITVGGLDDKNRLESSGHGIYHSSYGPTLDGLQKPEVIAPGIWVAAPLLPGTTTAGQAALLSRLENAEDRQLREIIKASPGVDADLDRVADLDPYLLRNLVWIKIRDNNVISGHYKHVDGTSFAAPIVSSIAAQMIEANPRLSPDQVKLALVKTANRLANVEVDRQGWGVVNPREAVRSAQAAGLARSH